MRWLYALLITLVLPIAGWAGEWSQDCKFTGTAAGVHGTATGSSSTVLDGSDIACYRYDLTEGAQAFPAPGSGKVIQIAATSANVCFDNDLFGPPTTVATTSLMTLRYCGQGLPLLSGTLPQMRQSCISVGQLDGIEGGAGTQNACVRVGPGFYFIDVNGACLATCQVSIQAEEGK